MISNRVPSDFDYSSWAAGFIEADGGIFIDKRGTVRIEVEQVDPFCVFKLATFYDGRVTLRGTRPIWRWRLSKKADVRVFIIEFLDYGLGPKRLQAQVALDLIDGERTIDSARKELSALKRMHRVQRQTNVQGNHGHRRQDSGREA